MLFVIINQNNNFLCYNPIEQIYYWHDSTFTSNLMVFPVSNILDANTTEFDEIYQKVNYFVQQGVAVAVVPHPFAKYNLEDKIVKAQLPEKNIPLAITWQSIPLDPKLYRIEQELKEGAWWGYYQGPFLDDSDWWASITYDLEHELFIYFDNHPDSNQVFADQTKLVANISLQQLLLDLKALSTLENYFGKQENWDDAMLLLES